MPHTLLRARIASGMVGLSGLHAHVLVMVGRGLETEALRRHPVELGSSVKRIRKQRWLRATRRAVPIHLAKMAGGVIGNHGKRAQCLAVAVCNGTRGVLRRKPIIVATQQLVLMLRAGLAIRIHAVKTSTVNLDNGAHGLPAPVAARVSGTGIGRFHNSVLAMENGVREPPKKCKLATTTLRSRQFQAVHQPWHHPRTVNSVIGSLGHSAQQPVVVANKPKQGQLSKRQKMVAHPVEQHCRILRLAAPSLARLVMQLTACGGIGAIGAHASNVLAREPVTGPSKPCLTAVELRANSMRREKRTDALVLATREPIVNGENGKLMGRARQLAELERSKRCDG